MIWFKRILVATGAPLIFLLVVELVLRQSGFGVDSCLYRVGVWDGKALATENPMFTRKYFGAGLMRSPWPVAFDVPKPADEYRVFLLGESAAMGDPIPEYGMARILEVLLQEAMPGKRVRVVNAAITAINSHVIREIAGEVADLEPDAVVMYMGNNEVVGPFGPGTVFGATRFNPMARLLTNMRGTRTGQALELLAEKIAGTPERTWEGMEMFLDRKVPPDDPRLQQVYRNFENNLRDILRTFSSRNIPVLVSTVAVNLRDCAPLGSPGPAYDANVMYERARTLDQQGDYAGSKKLFVEAMQHDQLRFRADKRMNEIIRDVADGLLVDGERVITEISRDEIPGEDFFYDHVHLTFSGQYTLARSFAAALTGRETWLGENEVARCLAWNEQSAFGAMEEMFVRRLRPPFTDQLDYRDVEARWLESLLKTYASMSTNQAADSLSLIDEAVVLRPEDVDLRRLQAEANVFAGRFSRAAEAYQHAARLLPHRENFLIHAAALLEMQTSDGSGFDLVRTNRVMAGVAEDEVWARMGECLVSAGLRDGAEKFFNRAWIANPENTTATINLGISRAMAGKTDEGLVMLRSATKKERGNELAWANYGRVLFQAGDADEAIPALERALSINPGNGLTQEALAEVLRTQGKHENARRHFESALQARPMDLELIDHVAAFAVELNDYAWAATLTQRATRLNTLDPVRWHRLAVYCQKTGDLNQAMQAIDRVLDLKPEDPYYLHVAGQLHLQGGGTNALRFLQEAFSRKPDERGWLYNLIWIYAVYPEPSIREPRAALRLVEQLSEQLDNKWVMLDLTSAALASDGRIAEAYGLLAREDLDQMTDPVLRNKIIERRELYRRGKAYHASLNEFIPVQ